MSVLIKGMEIPRNCWECGFCKTTTLEVDFCVLNRKQYNWCLEERPSDCPLIEVPGWIPVAERLPDFEGMCLCMRKSYSKANFRHQEIMYFDYDEQAFCSNVDGIFVADGNVTHWMPLPKPPKDGET